MAVKKTDDMADVIKKALEAWFNGKENMEFNTEDLRALDP